MCVVHTRPAVETLPPYVPGREGGLGQGAVDLASNENSWGPSPHAINAVREAAGLLHRYPDPHPQELVTALAEHHRLHPEEIMLGNGEDQLIRLLALAYLEPGARAVIPHPSFPAYAAAAQLAGAAIQQVPLTADGRMNLDAIDDALRGAKPPRLVFLCTPNNPTGGAADVNRLPALLERAEAVGTLIVVDEAYSEFSQSPSALGLVASRELAVLRTFSKAYGLAGLRVGWVAAPAPLIHVLRRVREPFSVNRLGIEAALAALRDQEHLTRTVTLTAEGRQAFQEEAGRRGLVAFPSDANFVALKVPEEAADDRAVVKALGAHGVRVRALSPMGLPGHLRVTIGRPEEMARFWRAWDGLGAE
jgi:histidinol-phosphate aminotransferase